MSVRLPVLSWSSLLGIGFVFAAMSAEAKDAPSTLEGIHVHRSGTSPHFVNSAKKTLKAQEDQCKLMKSVCAMMPAGANSKDKAACIDTQSGFSVKGNVPDVGRQETDEYFSTTPTMAARQTTKTVLQVKSICAVEVVQQKSTEIWHYAAKGHIHYVLKESPKKGHYWVRTEHKALSSKAGAFPAGVLPLSATSTVSPVLGQKTYAGHKCAVREITGPWSGTFCLKPTQASFPGHVTLAGKILAGEDVLLEDRATEVAEKIMLPKAHFFPPESDKIEDSVSPENPTRKWCAKQKIKTGIDPCEKGSADE
jgi:hypothetical protein